MHKKFFRLSSFLLLCAVLLCACAGKEKDSLKKSFSEKGFSLVLLMDEAAKNDKYLSLYTANSSLTGPAEAAAAGNRQTPKAVYEITISDETLDMLSESESVPGLSDELSVFLRKKTLSSIPSQINARGGAECLAASSVLTISDVFVPAEMQADAVYLYTFEDAFPAAVVFLAGENGAVSASGCFLLYDSFSDGSLPEIEAFFSEFGASVTQIS